MTADLHPPTTTNSRWTGLRNRAQAALIPRSRVAGGTEVHPDEASDGESAVPLTPPLFELEVTPEPGPLITLDGPLFGALRSVEDEARAAVVPVAPAHDGGKRRGRRRRGLP